MPKGTIITIPNEVVSAVEMSVRKPSNWHWAVSRSKFYFILLQSIQPEQLLLDVIAFFMSRVLIMGEIGPFGLAFFVAVSQIVKERATMVGVAAVIGVLSTGRYYQGGLYLIAVILCFLFLDKPRQTQKKQWLSPLLVFGIVILGEAVAMLWQEVTLYYWLKVIFNAAIGVVLVYIFLPGITILAHRTKGNYVSSEMLICLVMVLAVTVAGLGGITIAGYSVRNMVGSLVIMLLAFGGAGLGAAVGVAIGLVVDLTNHNVVMGISLYSIAGLLAGAFKPLGKVAVIIGFLLGCLMAALCFGWAEEAFLVLTEAAVAAAVILFIPAWRLELWGNSLYESKANADRDIGAIHEATLKLSEIGGMLTSLADNAGTIAATVSVKSREEEDARLLTAVGEQVCVLCQKRSECWEKNFYRTYQALTDTLALAEQGDLKSIKMSKILRDNCTKSGELAEVIRTIARHNYLQAYWKNKTMDARQAMSEQMHAVAEVIGNLVREIKNEEVVQQEEKTTAILEKSSLIGCKLDDVRVKYSGNTVVVEIDKLPCSGNRECYNTVLPLVSGILKERLIVENRCGNASLGKKCRICLRLAARYKVKAGLASSAKGEGTINGDTCAVTGVGEDRVAFILSDGMGSGPNAAEKSALAVDFLGKLLKANFSIDVAVKTVNSLLLLKQQEESFATIDMTVVDLSGGEAEFIKVGAAPSFIKRVGEVTVVKSATLPVGILQQVELGTIGWTIAAGDIIVMVSDGIADIVDSNRRGSEKELWIVNFLRRLTITEPQQIAEAILRQALDLAENCRRDDMTVLVGKVLGI
ncbi:MAG: stage sporulation protein serine/threonine phosphatase [Firmicutes bacterium]|nr:stage sporulation protein serine/threonine phosphatase [Bacillota bacterium]